MKESDVHFKNIEPDDTSDSFIQYGSYKNVAPLSFEQLQIFFTFPYPLPYFEKASRDIYVSHWGSISVDEYFKIINQAAGINGQFSRVDYMPHINPNNG